MLIVNPDLIDSIGDFLRSEVRYQTSSLSDLLEFDDELFEYALEEIQTLQQLLHRIDQSNQLELSEQEQQLLVSRIEFELLDLIRFDKNIDNFNFIANLVELRNTLRRELHDDATSTSSISTNPLTMRPAEEVFRA